MEQPIVWPTFLMIAVGASIFVAVALALRNNPAAKNGGVVAAALAVGVLALGWMFLRHEGVAIGHGTFESGVHEAAREMSGIWKMLFVIAAVVAALAFARTPMRAGIVALGVLAFVFVGYTSVSVDRPATVAVSEVAPSVMAPSHIPLDEYSTGEHAHSAADHEYSAPAPRKPSSNKARRSKNKSRSTTVPRQPTPTQPTAVSTPRAPEPADDEVAAIATTAAPSPVASAPPAATAAEHEHAEDKSSTASTPPIASSSSEQRPEWLDKPAEFSPDGTYTVVVRTNPYLRMQDARREIESKMRQEAREFVEMITRRRMSSRSHSRLPWDYISSKAKVADYQEITHSTGAGANMFVVHSQLKFTPKLQGEIEWIVEQSQVSQRTGFLVMIAGLVLALIGVVYAYLRLDTATKGYYTWRLRFLALLIVAGAFGTVCVVIDEYNLEDAFDTVYWHPVAQARSERLR